jgi:hypothetical protein
MRERERERVLGRERGVSSGCEGEGEGARWERGSGGRGAPYLRFRVERGAIRRARSGEGALSGSEGEGLEREPTV